ncbi:SPI-1 type III secretion system effector E3 ubiquitin transferase SlrP [Salmonella bongori]|nr:SPI-1 type III secretion system effector E3 ubiquitin transferase SlrP [Salmonella bongori]EDP8659001.1 SPI-1 type III secretion system effector E3 ubiquitin transferase SlrP [Salmonella bongori]EEU7167371.1 SPI-1 type III secretion system effector E3 ubiquitin transferase SlrP [Salmonella bongori]EIU0394375.1 SPI-1 type III secretion system effector E3 ubiquitin transferase SlrP [Salmonella bongori]
MFNITNTQSAARNQNITDEAAREALLGEKIWNSVRGFFSSEHQVEAQIYISDLCHLSETVSPEVLKNKFERLRALAFPAYMENIQCNRAGTSQYCILNVNSQEILSITFNTDSYTVECEGETVTYTLEIESEQTKRTSLSREAVDYELIWSDWVNHAPTDEAPYRESAVKRMRNCLEDNETYLRLDRLKLTTIPGYIPASVTHLLLDKNNLHSLPENLQANIQVLSAKENKLTGIPATLPHTIQHMDLTCNPISELPDHLPSSLETLIVASNELTALPDILPAGLLQLDVYQNYLTALPETLPTGIEVLIVGDNLLTVLPARLPENLQYLEASDNVLICLPELLPSTLKRLDISDNQLTTLPETLPSTLQRLDVSRNQLTSLPECLPSALQEMNACYNQLSRLPELLPYFSGDGPRPASLFVEHNPLTARAIQDIQMLMSAVDYRGPRIFFAMEASSASRVTRPLHEAVKAWLAHSGEEDVNKWQAFEADANAEAFSQFLDRLGETQNTRHPDFKEQVSAWLIRLADDNALRETAFIIAMDATESCEDRVTLAYHQMQQATLVHDAERGAFDSQLAELITVGREIFRLAQIEPLAREKVKRLFFIDEIEVFLGFQNQLRESLSLTTMTRDMRFYNVSGITESDLDEAEIRIKIAENSGFHTWFAQWGPWHKVLERIAPEEWCEMMDKRAEYIETDAYQSRINSELDALGIAGDSDAERMIGMRIIEEINQTLFTELMEKVLAKKGVSSLMNAYW